MNPATSQDIEARFPRPLTESEKAYASTQLGDAWTLLLAHDSTVESRLADGTLAGDLVKVVLCAAVIRLLRNPDGKAQEAIDDYSYTRDPSIASGSLYFTPAELGTLGANKNSRRSVRLVANGEWW